ncbi:MAG TPA: ABC transporter substrate-binding protein [Acetobacteraceae bacterium]|nr:ABC transporter substrate-binding protein [Acetobacteraceae bacterium]
MRRTGALGLKRREAFLLPLAALAARRARAEDTSRPLRISWREAIPNLDPYSNQLRAGFALAHEIWDTLVYRNPVSFAIEPLLATSWAWEGDYSLVFALRPGVRWHDDSAFGAEDVAYTINMIASDRRLSAPSVYRWLAGAEVIDSLRVRVRLKRPMPAALEYFAMAVWILPRESRVRSGRFARAAVGTGPYRVAAADGTSRIELTRFEGYYAGSPKGRPAIKDIVIRVVPDATTELADLLSGAADWIWKFDPDRIPAILRNPGLIATQAESMRIGYISFDAAGRTGPDNPLSSEKVRQAISHALDRGAMARGLVGARARPLDAPCYPTQVGCVTVDAVHYDYDPDRARQLLAEAGYPNGFTVQLVTYEPPRWSAVMQHYLRAVGIDAQVIQLPPGEVVLRAIEGQTRMQAGDWGSYSINDVSAILPHFFAFTPEDYTRDPRVRALIEEAGATRDTARRNAAYAQAIHAITAHADWLPLYTYTVTYAFSRDLDFMPCADELPRFFLCRWKDTGASGLLPRFRG